MDEGRQSGGGGEGRRGGRNTCGLDIKDDNNKLILKTIYPGVCEVQLWVCLWECF